MNANELPNRLLIGVKKCPPVIIQSEAAECGLACMAMITGYYGHKLGLQSMRSRFSASLKGVTLKELVRIGSSLNLTMRAFRMETSDFNKIRLPCVLHWNHNHFVVLVKVGKSSVVIHDPANGRRKVSFEEVSNKFTGVALEAFPNNFFEKKDERKRIHVLEMVKKTVGIGKAAMQIFSISILLELVTIGMPIGFQLVLDQVIVSKDYDLLFLITVSFLFLLSFKVLASIFRSWSSMLIGSSLALQWKSGLFSHLISLPLDYFEKRHVGDIVSRFNSLEAIKNTLATSAIITILDGIMSIVLVAMLFLYGGWLAVIPLSFIFLYALTRFLTYRPYKNLSEESVVYAAKEQSCFIENLRGMASIKSLNMEGRRQTLWVNCLVDRINANLKVEKFDIAFQGVGQILFGVNRIVVIYLGARSVMGDALSVGMLMAFFAYKDQFVSRVESFISTIMEIRMLSLHGERVADIALEKKENICEELARFEGGKHRSLVVRLS